MTIRTVTIGGVVRVSYDDTTGLQVTYDAAGVEVSRQYLPPAQVAAAEAASVAAAEADQSRGIVDQIEAGIAALVSAAQVADADATAAEAYRAQAAGVRDQCVTRAAQVRATTPVATVAYLAAIRDELGLVYDRLAQVSGSITESYQHRAQSDAGFALLFRSVAWLGQWLARWVRGAR